LQTKNLIAKLEKQKVKVKDLGKWLNLQFKKRLRETKKTKNGMQVIKAKIYADLDWNRVVKASMQLAGFNSFTDLQKRIDKRG